MSPNRNEAAGVPRKPVAWWRMPMMWIVIGGPLAVVVASFATLAVALLHPDVVVGGGDDPKPAPAHAPAATPGR